MNRSNQDFNDFFTNEIKTISYESALFIVNFLILEKIKKINSMTDFSFHKYISSRNINGEFIQNDPSLKEKMINDLITKSKKIPQLGLPIIRNEILLLINYFNEESSVQKKLIDCLIRVK